MRISAWAVRLKKARLDLMVLEAKPHGRKVIERQISTQQKENINKYSYYTNIAIKITQI